MIVITETATPHDAILFVLIRRLTGTAGTVAPETLNAGIRLLSGGSDLL